VLAQVALERAAAYAKPCGNFLDREKFWNFLPVHRLDPLTRAVCASVEKESGLNCCALKDVQNSLYQLLESVLTLRGSIDTRDI